MGMQSARECNQTSSRCGAPSGHTSRARLPPEAVTSAVPSLLHADCGGEGPGAPFTIAVRSFSLHFSRPLRGSRSFSAHVVASVLGESVVWVSQSAFLLSPPRLASAAD